jgi:transcriptional regulator with XRE-family HTH domain
MASRRRVTPRRTIASKQATKESLSLDREAIRYWRLQRGFTQEALARQRIEIDGELVGISYAQIRRIENDGRAGPASARILSALLGIELARLRPRDPRQRPCGLPRDVSVDFVGRSRELEAVMAALSREDNVRIAASLEGLPGVGKTELALQVCGRCEHTQAFRIFWLNAEQPDLTEQWGGDGCTTPRDRSRRTAGTRSDGRAGDRILGRTDSRGARQRRALERFHTVAEASGAAHTVAGHDSCESTGRSSIRAHRSTGA